MICYIRVAKKLAGIREQRISMEVVKGIPVIMYHYLFTEADALSSAQLQLQ